MLREGLDLDCNSENVIYLITCKKVQKHYVGSCITMFHTRFNNYCSCHKKFCRRHSVIQVSFHNHFMLRGHCDIDDWEIILIDEGCNKQKTRGNSVFGNISLTHLYHMVSMSEWWTWNGYNRMKQLFWINFELGE